MASSPPIAAASPDKAVSGHGRPAWLNLPCTDPLGRVFIEDGRVFRAIYPQKATLARQILVHPHVVRLMEDGLVAKMWIADRVAKDGGLVIEAERAAFDVPCDRFVRSCLYAALERWFEIALRLDGTKLCLSDAHFGNFMIYGRNQPRWIDLGSIRPVAEMPAETPFPRFLEFCIFMLSPLLLLRQGRQWERLVRLGIADGPVQGPKSSTGEATLRLDGMVSEQIEVLKRRIGQATGRDALVKAYEFACEHLLQPAPAPLPAAPTHTLPSRVAMLLNATHARDVACLGGDAFVSFAEAMESRDVVVVDEDETVLERVAAGLTTHAGSGSVALYLQHAVNRNFLRNPPQADAVLAIDPFERFKHPSMVADDNIAEILARVAKTLTVLTAPQNAVDRIAAALRRVFASVEVEPAATSSHAVLICRVST